jgi:hypothetical protein
MTENNIQSYKSFKVNLHNNKEKNVTIKLHKNKNDYYLTDENIWVRNFLKQNVVPKDINNFYGKEEVKTLLENEMVNQEIQTLDFFSETITHKKILIISDGFGFSDSSSWLDRLPKDVKIITVYGASRFWKSKRLPDYMVFTNPFEDSLTCLPERIFPFLIASTRSCNKFIKRYPNKIFRYNTTPDENYESPISHKSADYVDEYRSSISAAIIIASKMKCEKLCIAYPINAYEKQRPGTEKIEDTNFYFYPQQKIAKNIIDANLFWQKLGKSNTNISYIGIKNSLLFANYIEPNNLEKFYE